VAELKRESSSDKIVFTIFSGGIKIYFLFYGQFAVSTSFAMPLA